MAGQAIYELLAVSVWNFRFYAFEALVGSHSISDVLQMILSPSPRIGPGNVAGFSLHAGVAVKACQRDKLQRVCRYICRPPVSEERLFLTARGDIGYMLKTPYRDGTTHVIFEPLDFIARLAALVPLPRLNLTRFHGVFTPNSPDRARITPARRGRGARPTKPTVEEDRKPAEQR